MNNYHIYEEIGKGKYSVVYKGRKKKTIEYMAVKSLEKSRRTKLLNEVKMFSGLKHTNVLKFHNWYETKNHLWVILEYCPGGDMMSLIEADKKGLNESIVLRFIKDMAAGLIYLHSKGIIYCDLRPSNVLFNEYGVAKLSDLGNARRLVDMISATIGPDIEMNKRGSPYYMAPELFHDGGVYSFQSDLWALGCIAYELCCGQSPFQSSSFTELVDLILNADIKPQDLSIFELIKGLLDKDPLKRWGWDKICKFLNLQYVSIPGQPHFDTWCRKNSLVQRLTPQIPNNSGKQVDIVRLSLNVHKNMIREDNTPTKQNQQYHKQQPIANEKDVKLMNRDQEIMIGNEQKNEEEDDDNNSEDNNNNFNSNILTNVNTNLNNNNIVLANEINSPNVQFQARVPSTHPSTQSLISQSPIPGGITPQMKKQTDNDQLVPIDQLFTHSSDNSVKPIIGNREIEKSMEASYLKDNLPFQFINSDDVNRNIDSDQVELHFENIYNSLSSPTISQNDKLNILNYFEQILQTSNAANRLLNSAYVPLLLKLCKQSKLTQLKHRLCSVLGLLIRHATVIEPDVAQQGIVENMVEILNSKEQNIVRRKAAAALGEYLFYGATQMEEDPSNSIWELSNSTFNVLIKVLKSQNEDEIVKFYCIKAIENISSQSITTGSRFAQQDIILLLLQNFNQTKNENLRISCATAIANLLMIDNALVDQFVQVLGLKNLVAIFIDNLQRVQQAMITIFNIYLLQSLSATDSTSSTNVSQMASNAVNKLLIEESTLIKGLVYLLDHGNHVSRGKAAIALMLMIKFNIVTLLHLSDDQHKFYQILDKALRENNDYLKQCLQHLIQQLCDCTTVMIQIISDSLIVDDSNNNNNNNNNNNKKILGNQSYLNVLLQYASTPSLQMTLFSAQYLPIMTQLLNTSNKQPQVQTILFNIMSKLCTNSKVLIKQQQIIIQSVLKNCIEFLIQQENPEGKFSFLKLVIELLSALLQEEGVYDYPSFFKPYANDLNQIIINQVLPLLKLLFQDHTQLLFYGLKLASILLTYNAHFLPFFKKQKVLQIILDMFKPDGNSITGHTLNIVQKIIEGSTIEEIVQLQLLDKSVQTFIAFIKSNHEWAFEDLSQIMLAISSKIITELQRTNNKAVISPDNTLLPQGFPIELQFFQDQFLFTLPYAIQLMNNCSTTCQQTLLTYLLHLSYFYPGKLSSSRQQIFNQLIPCIQPILAKRIIKLFHWIVILNEQKPFKIEKRDQFIQLLEKLGKDDKTIAIAYKEIPKYII